MTQKQILIIALLSFMTGETQPPRWVCFAIGILISYLVSLPPDKPSPVRVAFYIDGEEESEMNLKVNQALPMTIVLEDEFGNPTGAADAPPAWSVTNDSLGSLVVADDGMSAQFNPSGKLGDCQVQVNASAAGATVIGSLDLTLVPGDVTQIILQPGTPVDNPVPPTA